MSLDEVIKMLMEPTKETLKTIIETCPSCNQILDATLDLKKRYPDIDETDIVSAVLEAVGDGPILGFSNSKELASYSEDYLKAYK